MGHKPIIILQGPTTYCDEIINIYSVYGCVIWSTWNTEPVDNLKKIKESGIRLILSDLPKLKGEWNCNFQCTSTFNGIVFGKAEFPEGSLFIKIRSDFEVAPLSLFIDRVIKTFTGSLMFVGYARSVVPYLMDYIVAGDFQKMSRYFSVCNCNDCGKPFPEAYLQQRFYGSNPILNKKVPDFKLINIRGIKIYWIKERRLIKWMHPSLYYNTSFKLFRKLILIVMLYTNHKHIKK